MKKTNDFVSQKEQEYIEKKFKETKKPFLVTNEIIVQGVNVKLMEGTDKYLKKFGTVVVKIISVLENFLSYNSDLSLKRIISLYGKENLFYRVWIDDKNMMIFSYENSVTIHLIINQYTERTDTVKKSLEKIESNLPKVMTTNETIDFILDKGCSLARFGDGEFNLVLDKGIGFQKKNQELVEKLQSILKSGTTSNLIVCIPEFNSKYNNIPNCFGELSFWEKYWLDNYDYLSHFFSEQQYGLTDVTRNTVFFENSLENIKRLWDRKKVVFVFGNNARFNPNNILFDNVSEYRTIETVPMNAYEESTEILKKCLELSNEYLFLLSLGPTATVLASELSFKGYQALDIGHLTSSYDQYLGKIKYPESLPLK